MSDKDNGGPAFPEVPGESNSYEGKLGMTLRDYFAAKSMAALVANNETFLASGRVGRSEGVAVEDKLSAAAYEFADAMLKARNK